MLKFFNILNLIFKEKTRVKSYNSDDDLEQFVSRRINSKLEVNKTQKHENELLKNLAGLRGITAVDVMVPRVDIVTVSMSDNFNDIVNQLTKANHSRVPVTGETKDDIVGIIHIKDVLANINSKKKNLIKYILKEPIFIAPSISLLDLLHEMRLKKRHMALVVDEYGGIDGLVTIEDLVEELVGEIEDEHDETAEIKIEKLNFNTIIVEARATLDFLKDKLSLDLFKFKNEEIETLGGYIISLSGRVPIKGEVIRDVKNKIEFEIINSDKRKIIKVKIKGLKLLNES